MLYVSIRNKTILYFGLRRDGLIWIHVNNIYLLISAAYCRRFHFYNFLSFYDFIFNRPEKYDTMVLMTMTTENRERKRL